jgi:hypothetical protein
MHPKKSVISRVEDGVRFLGYRIFPAYRRLPRCSVTRFKRRLARMRRLYAAGQIADQDVRRRLVAWIAHARHANTYRLRARLLREVSFVRTVPHRTVSDGGSTCGARRLVEQQCEEQPRGQPQQEQS